MKKVILWIILIFIVFFIAYNPDDAADVAQGIGGWIADIFRGFGTFFGNLVN